MEGLRVDVSQERRELEEFGKVEEGWRKEALEERNKVVAERSKQGQPRARFTTAATAVSLCSKRRDANQDFGMSLESVEGPSRFDVLQWPN